MLALALDMGGTHIGCGVVEDDRLLASGSIEARGANSLTDLLPIVTRQLHRLLHSTGRTTQQCAGVAVGFPGIVDARDGTIYSTLKKYEDAPEIDLLHWAREEFGLPLRIENDARMALLGEHFAGAGRGVQDIVMMSFGTGIGGAAILYGRLFRGAHAHGGCLGGHLAVKFDGHLCHCGNIGCAEAEASGWSMPLIAREQPGFSKSSLSNLQTIGFRELFSHANAGDSVAVFVRDRCLRIWSVNAVSLIHAYDPSLLILGGGAMKGSDQIVPIIEKYIHQHAWASWGKPQIRTASLGSEAALLGAVPLLNEEMHGT